MKEGAPNDFFIVGVDVAVKRPVSACEVVAAGSLSVGVANAAVAEERAVLHSDESV